MLYLCKSMHYILIRRGWREKAPCKYSENQTCRCITAQFFMSYIVSSDFLSLLLRFFSPFVSCIFCALSKHNEYHNKQWCLIKAWQEPGCTDIVPGKCLTLTFLIIHDSFAKWLILKVALLKQLKPNFLLVNSSELELED